MSSAGFFTQDSEKHFLLDVSEWNLQFYVGTPKERHKIFLWGKLPFIAVLTQAEMKNCMNVVCKKQPGFPLQSGKAACRRLAHTGSLLDYGKFMYGENAMWREIFTDHNKCLYIIQSGVSHY